MNPPITNSSPRTDETRRTLAERLEPTSRAVAEAHDAFLRNSIEAVSWERRGFLGRLTRSG
jgi:hypothetical protein